VNIPPGTAEDTERGLRYGPDPKNAGEREFTLTLDKFKFKVPNQDITTEVSGTIVIEAKELTVAPVKK
jgi:hypothetical protein